MHTHKYTDEINCRQEETPTQKLPHQFLSLKHAAYSSVQYKKLKRNLMDCHEIKSQHLWQADVHHKDYSVTMSLLYHHQLVKIFCARFTLRQNICVCPSALLLFMLTSVCLRIGQFPTLISKLMRYNNVCFQRTH